MDAQVTRRRRCRKEPLGPGPPLCVWMIRKMEGPVVWYQVDREDKVWWRKRRTGIVFTLKKKANRALLNRLDAEFVWADENGHEIWRDGEHTLYQIVPFVLVQIRS